MPVYIAVVALAVRALDAAAQVSSSRQGNLAWAGVCTAIAATTWVQTDAQYTIQSPHITMCAMYSCIGVAVIGGASMLLLLTQWCIHWVPPSIMVALAVVTLGCTRRFAAVAVGTAIGSFVSSATRASVKAATPTVVLCILAYGRHLGVPLVAAHTMDEWIAAAAVIAALATERREMTMVDVAIAPVMAAVVLQGHNAVQLDLCAWILLFLASCRGVSTLWIHQRSKPF
jgi:hypothetical protein